MKKILLLLLFVLPFTSSAQSILATTKDGREVLLKDDNTWQFLGTATKEKTSADDSCNLPADFKEPEGDKKIQKWLKRGDAQVSDLKKHVAVDHNVNPEEVILVKISEQKGNGNYVLCVNGKEVQYRRVGTVFMEKDEKPY